ncbi:monovalent cation/H(+) antiporter subunit G [Marivirga sp.]|uniref:monovalent cation/H(+) antiporter subunit G n=1 Tax=Marivirga sp. TaxID=2018662 RepID=UPI0025F1BDFE|nr:monovalent cation/H(+) antiporter subunit G [Marivirga sp.]
MISEIIILIFVFFGVLLMFIASLGLFKMPDLYTRMSAVTKAVTFKVGLIVVSASIYFNSFPVILKAILIIFLLLLTTPVSSHLLGKEAHERKAPLWKKTIIDELGKWKKKNN